MSNQYTKCFIFFPEGGLSVSRCDGSTKYGSHVNIDFYKINRVCACTLTPSFAGQLFFLSKRDAVIGCNTQVTVGNKFIFGCPISGFSSQTVGVQINQLVNVRVEYSSSHSSGTFYHCIGFQQNGKNSLLYK